MFLSVKNICLTPLFADTSALSQLGLAGISTDMNFQFRAALDTQASMATNSLNSSSPMVVFVMQTTPTTETTV